VLKLDKKVVSIFLVPMLKRNTLLDE